jgi:alkaline phosphatase
MVMPLIRRVPLGAGPVMVLVVVVLYFAVSAWVSHTLSSSGGVGDAGGGGGAGGVGAGGVGARGAEAAAAPATGAVIFLHPDGASAGTWDAARALLVGPDGALNWDSLGDVAVYKGHLSDNITATSNAGATIHATGVKAPGKSFGMLGEGDAARPIVDEKGVPRSVAKQARARGIPVGLVNSGTAPEPGTAAFVVDARSRREYDEIALALVMSDAPVLLSGGEKHFLPESAQGVHGPGSRKDAKDVIALARDRGYLVIRTREELLNLPSSATKVLGLFAHDHTFNDLSEEDLAKESLPLYNADAPTLAEMTDAALTILRRLSPTFLLVVEEEGSDNFGNANNASGVFEALRRTDEAIGVINEFIARNPSTLVLTTADSDAGGMRAIGVDVDKATTAVPPTDENGAPLDGVSGAGSAPFVARADRAGVRLPFAVAWASQNDVSGGIVIRAAGLNAHMVRGTLDNTSIADLIRHTLFGTAMPEVIPAVNPSLVPAAGAVGGAGEGAEEGAVGGAAR